MLKIKKKGLKENPKTDSNKISIQEDLFVILIYIETIEDILELVKNADPDEIESVIIIFNHSKELYIQTVELLSKLKQEKNLSNEDKNLIGEMGIILNRQKVNIFSN